MYHHSFGMSVSHYEPQPLLRAGDTGRPGRSPVNLRRVFTGGAKKSKLASREHSTARTWYFSIRVVRWSPLSTWRAPRCSVRRASHLGSLVSEETCRKLSTTACGTCQAALGTALHPPTPWGRAEAKLAAGSLHQLKPLCPLDPLLSRIHVLWLRVPLTSLYTCQIQSHRFLSQKI